MSKERRDGLPPDFDATRLLSDAAEMAKEIAGDVGEILRRWGDEAQYRVDKELGRALAKHPELYAEMRRLERRARRAFESWLR